MEFADPSTAGESLLSAGAGVNPAFGPVDLALAAATTGTLPVGSGGTGQTTATDNVVMVGNATAWYFEPIPDCDDAGGAHLNFDQGAADGSRFSCGSTGPAGGVPVVSFSTMGGITQTTKLYMGSSGNVDASEARAMVIAPAGLTLDNLTCVASVAPGGSDTFTITLADGDCSGALTDSTAAVCTISASAILCADTGSEAVASGECFALNAVASATAATSVVSCAMEVTG